MNEIERRFTEFAKGLASNKSSYKLWQEFEETTYQDPVVEKARQEIFTICDSDDSIGNDMWPLTEEAVSKINEVVAKLESKHS